MRTSQLLFPHIYIVKDETQTDIRGVKVNFIHQVLTVGGGAKFHFDL